jgi:hypothetical protein
MSYDIWLEPPGAREASPWSYQSENYTYNAAPMFEAVTGGSLHDLHDLPASEALALLEQAVVGMHVDREAVRALQPSNGWGDFDGFTEYVLQLAERCEEAPEMLVKVG